MAKTVKVKGWIIISKYGPYVDWKHTRSEMIEHHCSLVYKTWKECYKDGNRAVKATISYKTK